jgi:hypothetical protein
MIQRPVSRDETSRISCPAFFVLDRRKAQRPELYPGLRLHGAADPKRRLEGGRFGHGRLLLHARRARSMLGDCGDLMPLDGRRGGFSCFRNRRCAREGPCRHPFSSAPRSTADRATACTTPQGAACLDRHGPVARHGLAGAGPIPPSPRAKPAALTIWHTDDYVPRWRPPSAARASATEHARGTGSGPCRTPSSPRCSAAPPPPPAPRSWPGSCWPGPA